MEGALFSESTPLLAWTPPTLFSNALLFKDAVEIVAEDEGGRGYVHPELLVLHEF